jgi:hypothetical protein
MSKSADYTSSSYDIAEYLERSHALYDVLSQLDSLGARLLAIEDGRLGVCLPQGVSALPLALVETIREHKAALLELLLPQCLFEGHQDFWQHPVGYWVCATCNPATIAGVETVTLAPLPC